MKLLIITQKIDINDDVLGFFHGWVEEFAKHCEKVTVICLQKGEYHLSENVKVFSLGKEENNFQFSILFGRQAIFNFQKKIKYIFRFYKYIWRKRKNYDKVFVHMNSWYVILGGLFWRLLKKKIGLWYAHGRMSLSLKIAEKLSNIIFTSTQSGFRLYSKKINVVGQGINVDRFKIRSTKFEIQNNIKIQNSKFKIITVGRISPVKDYETLIKAAEILKEKNIIFEIEIIGGLGLSEQKEYLKKLKNMIREKNLESCIKFIGPIPNRDLPCYLQNADLFVNMSHTGSLDKAILEAMACGLLTLTCNEAALEVLKDYRNISIYPKENFQKLAEKIKFFIDMNLLQRNNMSNNLREIVVKNHNLTNLINNILIVYGNE